MRENRELHLKLTKDEVISDEISNSPQKVDIT